MPPSSADEVLIEHIKAAKAKNIVLRLARNFDRPTDFRSSVAGRLNANNFAMRAPKLASLTNGRHHHNRLCSFQFNLSEALIRNTDASSLIARGCDVKLCLKFGI